MATLRTSILRRRSFRILVRCVIAAIAVGLVTKVALAATTSPASTYRTATVTRAAVNETLEQTGTIEPVSQATVAFPTSGTIAKVDVTVGDTVTTGQTLATLDTTALRTTLAQKESVLADAELVLHKALNGESSSPTGGSGGASTGNGSGAAQQTATTATTAASAANTGTSGGAANAKLTAARDAVTKVEAGVRAALTVAQRALAAATQACNTTTSTTSTTTPTTTVAAAPPVSCSAAQAALLTAQQKVADAENTLAGAESKLAGLLAGTGTSSGGGSTSTPTTTPTKATSNATTASTITADQLVADEANVAAALADVNAANETLAQATIVSPIAGTVAAVNLSPGTQVSSDSSTANVVIVGRGGYEVTTTVTVADRPKVSVGDAATVTPDGSSAAIPGKVVSIGVATTSSSSTTGSSTGSSSTTSYPVTVGFTSEPAGLRNGASSALTIVVAHSESALTVPTSAVTTIGTGFHTVTMLANGKTSTVSIQIGNVGTDRTAVTSGLTGGQTVVLADLGQAIPSSNATTRIGGGGAFTGGGLGGGGLGGGGFSRGG
jgi:multidrug efflux pump subunit AcrA (membrane-fusion protein)